MAGTQCVLAIICVYVNGYSVIHVNYLSDNDWSLLHENEPCTFVQ